MFPELFRFWGSQALTQLVIDGRVYDLVCCYVAVGFRRLRPAQLSDSWADDVEGQTSGFPWRCRAHQQHIRNLDLPQNSPTPNPNQNATKDNKCTLAFTVFQCLTGNNVGVIAVTLCVVGRHPHLIITIRVQVCQVGARTLHIQHLGVFLWVTVDPILDLKPRDRNRPVRNVSPGTLYGCGCDVPCTPSGSQVVGPSLGGCFWVRWLWL